MTPKNKPDYFSCTTNDTPNSVVRVPCVQGCRVTYQFRFKSSLKMPYAVAINGKPMDEFRARPFKTGTHISLVVESGQEVSLFLNSDAHPDHRKHAVYKVTPNGHDVEVIIEEKDGRHADLDTPVQRSTSTHAVTGRELRHYDAPLTGDIWMAISHRYTAGEVDALMPAGTPPYIVDAIKNIYHGLPDSPFPLAVPATAERAANVVKVHFDDAENPRNNITNFHLLTDGLTRVHPAGYAAMYLAAIEAQATSLTMTSAWRPRLGSIAHRAGLGLDIGHIDGVLLNRAELTKHGAPHTHNVSDEEKRLFRLFQTAKAERIRANAQYGAAKGTTSESEKREIDKAAKQSEADAKNDWHTERDRNEPADVKQFRTALRRCPCVTQLLDPWYMDFDSHGRNPPADNLQSTQDEKHHTNHLHITVREPKIL